MFSAVRVALPEKSEAANVRKIGGAYKSQTSATGRGSIGYGVSSGSVTPGFATLGNTKNAADSILYSSQS